MEDILGKKIGSIVRFLDLGEESEAVKGNLMKSIDLKLMELIAKDKKNKQWINELSTKLPTKPEEVEKFLKTMEEKLQETGFNSRQVFNIAYSSILNDFITKLEPKLDASIILQMRKIASEEI